MIETLNSAIATDIQSTYNRYLERFVSEDPRIVSVKHFGVFSQDLIDSLATGVEDLMVSFGDGKKVMKRVFSILIEGLQNIRIHGEKDEFDRQLAFLLFAKNNLSYKIVFGNIIQNEDREILTSYLEKINNLDKDELKELYCSILGNGYISKKGGAGLGFLTMRMRSENKLSYTIENLDETKSLFTVEVKINRL